MKAVNLLPTEARHTGDVTLRGASAGTYGLLGGLALAVVLLVGYVLLANDVSSKTDQLQQINARAAAARAQVAKYQRFADLVSSREAMISQVRSLADDRFDWPALLARLANALPADVTLTDFQGALNGGAPTATPAATGAPATGPSFTLKGCTPSHSALGGAMDSLRAVEGVSDVTLQSSTLSQGATGAESDCGRNETFAVTVSLEGTAPVVPAAPAPTAGTATAGTSSTPAPASATSTTSTTPTTSTTATPATATPAAPAATAAAPTGGTR
jgi:Tfp pilus assembly protein PilN